MFIISQKLHRRKFNNTIDISKNVQSYIDTKFFHLMVSQLKISQNAAKGVYDLVPMQDFSEAWTDEKLYAKYGFTDEEIAYIESSIKPQDSNDND